MENKNIQTCSSPVSMEMQIKNIHIPIGELKLQRLSKPSVFKDVEQLEISYTVEHRVIW